VRLSGFGSNGLVFGAARIAPPGGGSGDSARIGSGADPQGRSSGQAGTVSLNVPALTDLAINSYTAGAFGPATGHFNVGI
jgi:hypothetical protein